MMTSSEGTQFGFDFGIVEVDGGNFKAAKLVTEMRLAQPSQLGCFAQGKLSHLEKSDGQLETQLIFEGGPRFSARQQEVVWILQGQLSHQRTLNHRGAGVNSVADRAVS
jgi:hypothetical protein